MNYPSDWPRCSCGAPCLDGKDSCGELGHRPQASQRSDEGWTYPVGKDDHFGCTHSRVRRFGCDEPAKTVDIVDLESPVGFPQGPELHICVLCGAWRFAERT